MPGYKNSPGFSFNRRLSTSVGPSAQAQISTVVPSAREATSTYDIGGWRLDREASFQGRVLGRPSCSAPCRCTQNTARDVCRDRGDRRTFCCRISSCASAPFPCRSNPGEQSPVLELLSVLHPNGSWRPIWFGRLLS